MIVHVHVTNVNRKETTLVHVRVNDIISIQSSAWKAGTWELRVNMQVNTG